MKKLVLCDSTGCWLPEKLAEEMDVLRKSLPKDTPYIRKTYIPEYQFEPNERAEVSIITTSSVDKTNEVVIPLGIDLSSYQKSGVVLYEHDNDAPVGECQWIKYVAQEDGLRAKTKYFEPEENVESKWYKFVGETWYMVKSGAMKGKSIGFQPLLPKRDPTEEELKLHPEWKGAGVWEKTLLLEYSVCSIGINNDSVVEMINKKAVTAEAVAAMGIRVPEEIRTAVSAAATPETATAAQAAVQPEPCCRKSLFERLKGDDCVSQKIPKLLAEGYPQDQAAAIAYSMCRAKSMKKKLPRRKSVDEMLDEALSRMTLDSGKISRMAEQIRRDRGRV